MKVKRSALAKVLGYAPAAITNAVNRGSLNTLIDGMIDLDDLKNRTWLVKKLHKQGCEIPQDIKFLFLATPVTESKKSESKNDGNKQPDTPTASTTQPLPALPDNGENEPGRESKNVLGDMPEAELRELQKHVSATQRVLDKAKADKAVADADAAQTKAANLRRKLVEINPLARLLFGIVSAQRIQVTSAIPNISSFMLNDIISALKEDKSKEEILMQVRETWTDECAKIFKTIDKELKYRVSKAKEQELTPEEFESAA